MEGIKNKVAIVTGGTRGIGLGIAKALVSEGARVLAVYRADKTAARAAETDLAALAKAHSGEIVIQQGDVSKLDDCGNIAAAAVNRWGGVDMLINNAGVFDFAYLDVVACARRVRPVSSIHCWILISKVPFI